MFLHLNYRMYLFTPVLKLYLHSVFSYTWFTKFLFCIFDKQNICRYTYCSDLHSACSYTWITECIYLHLFLNLIYIVHFLTLDLQSSCSVSLNISIYQVLLTFFLMSYGSLIDDMLASRGRFDGWRPSPVRQLDGWTRDILILLQQKFWLGNIYTLFWFT
jgi:hypothetical protein